ncbi:hypothetical protein N0V88_007622 [Collariella sp. IMI 366227]|nr:hypothetical protein N0V88_007622 [Collariella sp. IMI 366227]
MQTIRSATAASVGSRLLGEIEETTLDEIDVFQTQVLASLRAHFTTATSTTGDDNAGNATTTNTRLISFPIGPLNDLVHRHFRATQSVSLAVSGRHLELLYVLIATLITSPHEKAVSIVDFEGRFEPLRLLSTRPVEGGARVQRTDLDHVHITRPAHGNLAQNADCVASIENYMLYGSHQSRGREWWGTIVIGGGLNPAGSISAAASAQVAVTAGWKGWLRVDREDMPTFWDMSAEEALVDREKRQAAVDDVGWLATSLWGGFTISTRERDR